VEGGAVHKSGGKGAAPAQATHRRVINYYPAHRARAIVTPPPPPLHYYPPTPPRRLTLLSPRHSPAGGPEIASGAAPISAQFYSPLCLACGAIDFNHFARATDMRGSDDKLHSRMIIGRGFT